MEVERVGAERDVGHIGIRTVIRGKMGSGNSAKVEERERDQFGFRKGEKSWGNVHRRNEEVILVNLG